MKSVSVECTYIIAYIRVVPHIHNEEGQLNSIGQFTDKNYKL